MSQEKSALITQAELNETGIKTQLTQNDLLEVIVSERIRLIEENLGSLNSEAQAIRDEYASKLQGLKAEATKAEVKRLKIPISDERIDEIVRNIRIDEIVSWERDKPGVYTKQLSVNEWNKKREIREHTVGSPIGPLAEEFDSQISLRVSEELPGYAKTTKYYLQFRIKTPKELNKELLKLKKRATESNIKINEFYRSLEKVNINPDDMLKKARVEFNKKLISSSAPKLRAKIKEFIGVELE